MSSFAVPIKTISLTLTLYWNITFLSRNLERTKFAGETRHSKEQIPTNFSTGHLGQCLPSTVQTTVNSLNSKLVSWCFEPSQPNRVISEILNSKTLYNPYKWYTPPSNCISQFYFHNVLAKHRFRLVQIHVPGSEHGYPCTQSAWDISKSPLCWSSITAGYQIIMVCILQLEMKNMEKLFPCQQMGHENQAKKKKKKKKSPTTNMFFLQKTNKQTTIQADYRTWPPIYI